MKSWLQRDIEAARAACDTKIIDPSLGFVANLELADPTAKQRINDEGFDARVAGVALDANPYFRDGEYGWWRNGWFAADDNISKEGHVFGGLMKAIRKSRMKPVSTAKRPDRLVDNRSLGGGHGNPPAFMKKAILVLLYGIGIVLAVGILVGIRAAFS